MIKYGYSNGKYKFCEIEDETLEHRLYDSETLNGISKHMEGKLNDATIKIKIKYRDIFLGVTKSNNKGIDTNNSHKVNKTISIVKWMIWNQEIH